MYVAVNVLQYYDNSIGRLLSLEMSDLFDSCVLSRRHRTIYFPKIVLLLLLFAFIVRRTRYTHTWYSYTHARIKPTVNS